MNNPDVIRSVYGSRGRLPITHEIQRPRALGPEFNPWYWTPNHYAIVKAPDWFMKDVKAVSEDLEVCWNPITERWQVWVQAKTPRGWRLLFIHHLDGAYLPLDERLLARLYGIDSTRNGGAKAYFDRVVNQIERDNEKREAQLKQEAIDRAMPFWEYSQIKNIGKGSKFSTYFA